jgi:hypothetical protein
LQNSKKSNFCMNWRDMQMSWLNYHQLIWEAAGL